MLERGEASDPSLNDVEGGCDVTSFALWSKFSFVNVVAAVAPGAGVRHRYLFPHGGGVAG